MSCRSTPSGSALTTLARLHAGASITDVSTLSMFHELRRKYNSISSSQNLSVLSHWNQDRYYGFIDNEIRNLRYLTLSEVKKASILRRLQAARNLPMPELSILYALINITGHAKNRAQSIENFCRGISTRVGIPLPDVRQQFNEVSSRAVSRRRNAIPHTQINIDLSLRYGIGTDVGFLNAVSLLNDQARAIEASRLTDGVPRITRTKITNPIAQNTGIDNLLVKEIGTDPRNQRIEYLILDTLTGESQLYAYIHGGYAELYTPEYLADLANESLDYGVVWATQIRGRLNYAYPSPEAAVLAGQAMRCNACGQFSTVNHGCPMRSEPQVITFESTSSLWSNQTFQDDAPPIGDTYHRIVTHKVNLPPIREFRNALLTGAVKVEGIMYGGYRGRVFGNFTAYLDDNYALKINTSELVCRCDNFTQNGTCIHIDEVVKGINLRLTPAMTSLQAKTPAKREAMIAKAHAKLEVEALEHRNKAFRTDWTRNEETLIEAKKNWRLDSEVLYSEDFEAFQRDYLNAAEERVGKAEPTIAYSKINPLNGLATRQSGQGFGVELEYSFPAGMSSVEVSEASEKIGRELFLANLTSTPDKVGYHHAKNAGYKDTHIDSNGRGTWSWEQDGTVAGELVSPTMYDEPETWEKLEQAITILRKNGAVASKGAGSHVHVGTGFYQGSPEKYTELARIMTQHEDVLFRLATDPKRGTHRLGHFTNPVRAVPNNGFTSINEAKTIGRSALSFGNVQGGASDHPEFRIFDSSLNPGAVQAQIKLAVAMTHAAVRQVAEGGTKRTKEPLGSHLSRVKALGDNEISLEEETTTLRSLLDTLFTRHEDKTQMVSIFANTKWSKGQEIAKRRRPRSSY